MNWDTQAFEVLETHPGPVKLKWESRCAWVSLASPPLLNDYKHWFMGQLARCIVGNSMFAWVLSIHFELAANCCWTPWLPWVLPRLFCSSGGTHWNFISTKHTHTAFFSNSYYTRPSTWGCSKHPYIVQSLILWNTCVRRCILRGLRRSLWKCVSCKTHGEVTDTSSIRECVEVYFIYIRE